ncbi:MAG: HAMP domain-containing sensor histidine kinase [Burkholderiales bacterium]|nr:HAMP domain-containing sensor histidine kinase [Burkholderiales bacterium]
MSAGSPLDDSASPGGDETVRATDETTTKRGAALPYPRSFFRLLLVSLALVSLPLSVALVYAAWRAEQLSVRSQSALYDAVHTARTSRALFDRLGSIDRLAQQTAVLGDPALLEDFMRAHRSFREVAVELRGLRLGERSRAALERAIALEDSLLEMLTTTASAKVDRAEIDKLVGELVERTRVVMAASHSVVDREAEAVREEAANMQQWSMLLALFGAAATLTLAVLLTRILAKPIGALDAAIRELGQGDFSRPIRVPGPTDLRTIGERLDWLRCRLAELEDQKNRFLRSVSHELKTPLAAMREGAELLGDGVAGPLGARQRQIVDIMRESSVRLQKQIDALLDYQRTLHAAAALHIAPASLDALVRTVAGTHALAAQAKDLRLRLALEPVRIEADADKLHSVLDNLLGNAIKYTPRGGEIALVTRAKENAALLEVIDSGPGVPPEERESVFNTYFRGRRRADSPIEGSGLGLAIAREYVEAHGGRIAIADDSTHGHFQVTLPLRQPRNMARTA